MTVLTISGELSDDLVNRHLIKLIAFWGQERDILRMFLQNPLKQNHPIAADDKPDPLTALTDQLSIILGGEAQTYWNNVLTVAHMVQFHGVYEVVKIIRVYEM